MDAKKKTGVSGILETKASSDDEVISRYSRRRFVYVDINEIKF